MQVKRIFGIAAVFAAASIGALASASPASAAEAVGCQGMAVSYTQAGTELDRVTAPGPGGTNEDPFLVDFDGTIRWSGSSDAVLQNGAWSVSIGGFPLSGDVTNESGTREASGTDTIGSKLPAFVKTILQGEAKILVTGEVTGSGGQSCVVAVWIQNAGAGSPVASPMGITGIAAGVLGLLLLGSMLLGTKAVAAPAAVTAVAPGGAYQPPPGGYPPPPPANYPPPPPPPGSYPPPPPPPPG